MPWKWSPLVQPEQSGSLHYCRSLADLRISHHLGLLLLGAVARAGFGGDFMKIKGLESSNTTLRSFAMMNGDNDFPLCMSFFAITKGFGYLIEWVTPVNDGYNPSGFKKILQNTQVPPVYLRDKEAYFLSANPRQKWPQGDCLENSSQTASGHDKDSVSIERAPVVENRMMRVRTENQIVSQPAAREIFSRVIDNVVGADRSCSVHIPRAAHGSHFGPE